jgi:hypothetical protein
VDLAKKLQGFWLVRLGGRFILAGQEKKESTGSFSTVEKMVYDKLRAGETDISELAQATKLSNLEVKVAIQLLTYRDLVICEDDVPRLKNSSDSN